MGGQTSKQRLPAGKILPFPAFRIPSLVGFFLIWTLVGLLSYARHSILEVRSTQPGGELWGSVLEWLTCFWPWAVMSPLVVRLERMFPLSGRRWLPSVTMLAAFSVPITVLVLEGIALLRHSWWTPKASDLVLEQFFYWCTVLGACIWRNLLQARENERRTAQLALEKSQLENELRRAELEVLRMRLNPHFLFNTLQNISVLAQQQPKIASQMLSRLGDLLRAALRGATEPETTVAAETDLLRTYVAIEEMRFGDRLSVLIDIAPEARQALLPGFLLQPLVENAIVHGLAASDSKGLIAVTCKVQDGVLILRVSDNGRGLGEETERREGIGLGATRQRLQRMYGPNHEFVISNLPEGGTEVRISIPLRIKPSSIEHVRGQTSFTHR